MSELSLSNAKKEFVKVVFFLLSNPLYFSYFIFFSPYLFKLFSFLSPLFVTTTLLVLAFLTTTTLSPSLVHDHDISDTDSSEGFRLFEEFEVYKIVFEYNSSALEIRDDDSEVVKETCSEEKCSTLDSLSPKDEIPSKKIDEVTTTITKVEAWNSVKELVQEEDNKCNIIKEGLEFESPESGFEDKYSVKSSSYCNMVDSPRTIKNNGSNNLASFGSMRSEKEWTRTLACKLFEERHNNSTVGGAEGMDLLWETYETESNKSQGINENNKNKMRRNSIKNKGKKSDYNDNDEEEEEEEDCEDDERNGQLCCLQALKFSAGKMNLGIGRPNLLKFSKALKGIGWIHNVARNSKKRNNKD